MRARNIDAIALVCLTLLLLVMEAAANQVSAFASTISMDGWCPRTAVRQVMLPPVPPMPRVELPTLPRLPSMPR